MSKPTLCISIVSHGQGQLVSLLLKDLSELSFSEFDGVSVVVVLNLPEDEGFLLESRLSTVIIRNLNPKGFGHNHNSAFEVSNSDYFVVLNPDVRLNSDFSFHQMVQAAENNFGVAAPLVIAPNGGLRIVRVFTLL